MHFLTYLLKSIKQKKQKVSVLCNNRPVISLSILFGPNQMKRRISCLNTSVCLPAHPLPAHPLPAHPLPAHPLPVDTLPVDTLRALTQTLPRPGRPVVELQPAALVFRGRGFGGGLKGGVGFSRLDALKMSAFLWLVSPNVLTN